MGSSKSFEKRLMSYFQTDRSGTLGAPLVVLEIMLGDGIFVLHRNLDCADHDIYTGDQIVFRFFESFC